MVAVNATEDQARTATRRLLAAYLVIAGAALVFPHRPALWAIIAALHACAIVALLQIRPYPRIKNWVEARIPRTAKLVGDWYAIALIPALYSELAILNVAVWNGHYFDSHILGWEDRLFGGRPFQDLARSFPSLFISEFLHFAYISYYFIIYAPAVYLYARGRKREQQQLVFALLLAFFAHYVFFIYYPVQGPRYIYAAPDGVIATGFFYGLAHQLLEAGSSRGAAFPSSHVGVSVMATMFSFIALPRIAPVLVILTIGLAVGAVYGGFHYATDALAGMLFGIVLFIVAPRLMRWLGST